jgi:hypothetical protein
MKVGDSWEVSGQSKRGDRKINPTLARLRHGRSQREGASEKVAGGGMARKRHALMIRTRGRQQGSGGSSKKFGATEQVQLAKRDLRDTPMVSLLEQGRVPPLLQMRDDGGWRREMSKEEVG